MIRILVFYSMLPFYYDANVGLTSDNFRVRESAWKKAHPLFLASCKRNDPDFVYRQSKVDWHIRFAVKVTVPFDAAWSVIKQSKLVGVNQGWGTFIFNDVQQFAVNHTNYDELWSMH